MSIVQNPKEWMKLTSDLIKAGFSQDDTVVTVPDGIDFEEIIEYARAADMDYALLSPLVKLELPGEILGKVRQRLIESTLATLAQVKAARELDEAYEREGIRFHMLKGTVLKSIYPKPEMREMSDIDVMIYDESLEKAEEVAKKLGYEKVEAVKHHVIYKKEPFLILEIHWSLYDKHVDKDQDVYFNDSVRARLKAGTAYTYEFTDEDFYVYMIAHMAKHFYENGCGIRNLMDIYVFMDKYGAGLDKNYLAGELSKCGLTEFEARMRKLAEVWIEGKEPSEFEINLFSYMLDSGIYGKAVNGIWGQMAKQEDLDGANMEMNYYFPKLSYMKENYKWLDKFPFLLPAAWCIRAVHGIATGAADRRSGLKNVDDENRKDIVEIYKKLELNFRK
ncbi:Uncharacterised nucleotidyltransferase [Lachnospiraceae bacterium KH1T2]|nr:Uncharacterised nucleotidyltransferase [Lachnospiraceae bacterium KH1T2]